MDGNPVNMQRNEKKSVWESYANVHIMAKLRAPRGQRLSVGRSPIQTVD